MEQTAQNGQDRAWIAAALEDALDPDSPILRSFQAGELPALYDIADGLLANQEDNQPDREIVIIAAVYLLLGDLLIKIDPSTSDRAMVVVYCRELGCLGAWLIESQPRTLQGARALIHLAGQILEAREIDPGLALAQGPAEKLLALALSTLKKRGAVVTSSGHVMTEQL